MIVNSLFPMKEEEDHLGLRLLKVWKLWSQALRFIGSFTIVVDVLCLDKC